MHIRPFGHFELFEPRTYLEDEAVMSGGFSRELVRPFTKIQQSKN